MVFQVSRGAIGAEEGLIFVLDSLDLYVLLILFHCIYFNQSYLLSTSFFNKDNDFEYLLIKKEGRGNKFRWFYGVLVLSGKLQ